jgi:hypothetical protein
LVNAFTGQPRIAVGVTKVPGAAIQSHFHRIVTRDSVDETNFDLSLDPRYAQPRLTVPEKKGGVLLSLVPGIAGVAPPPDRKSSQRVARAIGDAIHNLRIYPMRFVDTRVLNPSLDLSEIERCFAESALILTTRLHGSLLALRNEIPFISIDPSPEGSKITRIVHRKLGWPYVLSSRNIEGRTIGRMIEEVRRQVAPEDMTRFRESAERLSADAVDAAGNAILEILGHKSR